MLSLHDKESKNSAKALSTSQMNDKLVYSFKYLTVVIMGKLTASDNVALATNQPASAIAHNTPAANPGRMARGNT